MFEADRPILNSEQDRLGRTTFSKYLARSILDHNNTESLVVGLYGGWGVGKTSLINLTLEELRFAASNRLDAEKPIILNFSPWSYSGQNQLIYSFFRRLSSEIRQSAYLEKSDRIIYLLELYISFFTHKPIPKPFRLKNFWSRLFPNNNIYGWESGHDLTLVKAELNELLRHQKHKIIVIIDNISRIEDTEIKQIFQIVKSIGDYSNTVYLLSMDKKLVTQAMDRIYGADGKELLDKIVQLPFDVPPISKQDLENILLDKLKRVIETAPMDSWDSRYWADVYYSTLRYFFENCRDITRYVNTISFGFDRLKDVVNPVDFFAITAVEVFEPKIYEGIRENRDLFTNLIDQIFPNDPEKLARDKIRCDEILDRAQCLSKNLLLQLLIFLFPRLHNLYQSTFYHYHGEAESRKNRRICTSDLFDVYFRLSMSSGHIPSPELDAILTLANSSESFDLALTRLNQDNRIDKFLGLLDGIPPEKIPVKHIPNMINALIDNADLFPEGESGLLNFNTPMRIHRILQQLLNHFDQPEQRFELFGNAINSAVKSLSIIIHELSEEHDNFTPLQLETLRKMAVEKIKFWAETDRLVYHPKLIPILHAWKTWGNENDCAHYVDKITQTDRGLLSFLIGALRIPIEHTILKLETRGEWEKYLINIEEFIPTHKIEAHAKLLFEDPYFEKLREREQLALLIFLDLINAKTIKIIPKTI